MIPESNFKQNQLGQFITNPLNPIDTLSNNVACLVAELRTANLIAYLALAEARGAIDKPTAELNAQILNRLELDTKDPQ